MSDIREEIPIASLPVSVGAVSETGLREENQDCMTGLSSPFGTVYLIADGMGGHRGGAQASRLVVDSFSRHLLAMPPTSPVRDALNLAVRLANIDVLELSKSGNPDLAGMGSTVVIALIRRSDSRFELTTAHVGDSRAYLYRAGTLRLLTRDHTHVQWLIETQALDEESARNHPQAGVLTRAMGHTTDLQADIGDPIALLEGDAILICSDGLSGFVNSDEISSAIERHPDSTDCAQELVRLALARGSDDNITVQLLRIGAAVENLIPSGTAPAVLAPLPAVRSSAGQNRWTMPLRLAAALALLVAICAAATLLWLRFRPAPSPKDNSEVQKLVERIKSNANEATNLHGNASRDLDQINGEIKTANGALKAKLTELRKKFDEIAGTSGRLSAMFAQKAEDAKQFQTLPRDQQKLRFDDTQQEIDQMEKTLQIRKENLKTLEDEKAKLDKPANPPLKP